MHAVSKIILLVLAGVTWTRCCAAQDNDPNGPWKYTLETPADGWQSVEFSADGWSEGPGGFGNDSTPGARVNTEWLTSDIWLRRSVSLGSLPARPALYVHHDEEADIYINGVQVAALPGFVREYEIVPLDEAAGAALKIGKNVLAVHCHQTGGGQFIDVHLVDAEHVPTLPVPASQLIPYKSDLVTTWGEHVTAENVWQEYPRPHMERSAWVNLNGHWDYAMTSGDQTTVPERWDGQILVPFCPESKLSGVQRLLQPTDALWYRRTFEASGRADRRCLLNFEAVDYRCRVLVNGVAVGTHVGGNLPFTIDATTAIRKGTNELVVRVEDTTSGAQLRGKQTLQPEGIWYTRVSGIWQTVWMEEVSPRHVAALSVSSDVDQRTISVHVDMAGDAAAGESTEFVVSDGDRTLVTSSRAEGILIPDARLWSPSDPHLYGLTVRVRSGKGALIDEVKSYFGMRKVGQVRDADGNLRFTLNDQVIFHWGPLDQGWWPDGLLTPPSDAAMRSDVEFLKAAGFNMIRKHIKVEPRRFYFACDRIGMMVWQDQPSGGNNPRWTRMDPNPTDASWEDADHQEYLTELDGMMDALGHFPCIVVWVPFNEAWGQHRTEDVGHWTVARDPSRLVNIASGGNFWPVGHVADHHSYPHPEFPLNDPRFKDYIRVVGEFGGHGWAVQEHLWFNNRRNWGYGGLPQSIDEYKDRYRESLRILTDLKGRGIAAGVYTQTTDVEGEVNGLLTYDRRVTKIPADQLARIAAPLLAE